MTRSWEDEASYVERVARAFRAPREFIPLAIFPFFHPYSAGCLSSFRLLLELLPVLYSVARRRDRDGNMEYSENDREIQLYIYYQVVMRLC